MAAPTISALADVALLLNEALTATAFTVAERIAAKAPANGLGRIEGQPVNGAAVSKNDDNDLPYLARVYVGGTGAVKVTTGDGDVVTFSGVPAGDVLPVLVRRVWSTGTTATNMVAVW